EPDAFPDVDNSSNRFPQAPSTRPLISQSRVATIRRRSAPPPLREIHVPTIGEILAYRSTLRGLASNAFRLLAPEDAGRYVSSVAPLTILRWRNIPALLQRLAD